MSTSTSMFRANPVPGATDALRQVRTEFLSGQSSDTIETCRRAVEAHPGNPNAWFMLGVLEAKSGRSNEAISALEQAIALRPAHAVFREALALVLLDEKRYDDAASQYEYVDQLVPGRLRNALRLALIAVAAKDHAARRRWLIAALKRAPRAALGILDLGMALSVAPIDGLLLATRTRTNPIAAIKFEAASEMARRGHASKAITLASAASKSDPGLAAIPLFLSELHSREENHVAALDSVSKGLDALPGDPDLLARNAECLLHFGRFAEANFSLAQVKPNQRDREGFVRAVALAFLREQQTDAALPHLERHLVQRPDDARALHAFGDAFRSLGWVSEAHEMERRAVAIDATYAPAWQALAEAGQLTLDGPLLRRLLARLSDHCVSQASRAYLHFAAGRAFERGGDTDAAFEHFERGNALVDVTFSPSSWSRHIDALCRAFDKDRFARASEFGQDSARPIFIVGMPHSGTAMVEAILGRHLAIATGGERGTIAVICDDLVRRLTPATPWPGPVPILDHSSCRAATARYLADLQSVSPDAAHVTDGMPLNFLHLGLIATLFPKARIVHCQRDSVETCLSLFAGPLPREQAFGFDLGHLGFYHREYERLMRHWRTVLPVPIIDVRYEELIADRRGVAESLAGEIGLEWNERLAAEPTARGEPSAPPMARRKAYARHLGPLLAALGAPILS